MNMQSKSDSYAAAGVDITAGYKAVELMKKEADFSGLAAPASISSMPLALARRLK